MNNMTAPSNWEQIKNGIFAGESGGDYDALFGFSNREGGRYAGVKLTDMTVDEAIEFANPRGDYGQWVKSKVGRVATPMGAYQIVGTTLRNAKSSLGLTGSERMTPELQDKLGLWIYSQQGTGAWEGYRGPQQNPPSPKAGAAALPAGLNVPHANPTPSYLSRREERDLMGPDVGAWEGMKEAISSEWAGSWALAQMGADEFRPDPEFRYSEELWKELTDGLPDDYHSIFDDAVSEAHARALRERADEMVESDQKLAQLGGWGTAMRIGAAVFDPVAIGASLLTEGVAAPVLFGAKATRVGRALRAGVSAGAANAAVEGYIASQDPTRGAGDVLLAGATGLVLGGALGAFVPTKMDMELERVGREIQREFVKTPGDPQSLGAARVGTDQPVLTAAERQLAAAEGAPRSSFGKARIDMVGTLKQSEHPIVRRLAGSLAEDGVGNADGSVLTRSASENVSHAMKVRMTKFYRTAEPAYREWLKEMGVPFWKRGLYREHFFEEVGKAVRRPDGFYSDNVHINKVANAMRDMQRDLLHFAKEKGIRGFDNVSENAEYLMRIFHHRKLDEMIERFSEPVVRRMVARAIMRGSDDFDYQEAHVVAKAYLKSIRSQKYQDVQLSRVFSEDQADLLEEILMDTGDLSAEEVASIVGTVRKPQGSLEEGRIARGKRRLRLDETYRETIIDNEGKQFTLGIEDFLDNNAERLMTLYTRQIAGQGLSRMLFASSGWSGWTTPSMLGLLRSTPSCSTSAIQRVSST